ncbi:MAG: F0F1 ATP synthase subunit delta [Campylobacter sp.]
MKDLVAKRYVKALLADLNSDEFNLFLSNLKEISSAFSSDKFINIINSPTINNKEKIDFILSLVGEDNKKFVNFIRLLGDSKRLDILPNVADELLIQKSKVDNVYYGKIYASQSITASEIANLERSFSNKFGAKVVLELAQGNYNGIKIELDNLGVEVSFSIDRLKTQMSEYILKAI